uniref:Uncharacterized protein n=1 Tax=Arundo donax TaxID=35708 RepID=A0A0A8Z5R2_ARUDO
MPPPASGTSVFGSTADIAAVARSIARSGRLPHPSLVPGTYTLGSGTSIAALARS